MIGFDRLGEITVLWPQMLWLLAPLPFLAATYVWLVMRRSRARAKLPGLWSTPAARSAGGRLRRTLPPLLFVIALAALIAGLARPQAVVMLPSLYKDVILALDISGSMRATDVKPNRLAAAQDAARAFIERRPPRTRVGIVAIAGSASLVQSPTENREDLLQAIERLQLQRGTALGSGLYVALATLLPDAGINLENLAYGRPDWASWSGTEFSDEKKKVAPGSNRSAAIVLLSDGESNEGPEPADAAKLAADHGVRIYTVGIGSTEGAILGYSGWSMRVRLDETALRRIADITQGDYYAATSAQDLKNVYQQLSARMVVGRTRTVEVTAVLVGVGALLLAISALCSVLWFNRVV